MAMKPSLNSEVGRDVHDLSGGETHQHSIGISLVNGVLSPLEFHGTH